MDFAPNLPCCRTCGREIDRGVAPGAAGNCERCWEESVSVGSAESRRRGVVQRLRGRYAEAQEWIIPGLSASPHSNLEWILGLRSSHRDDAALEASVCELVVLWLEDLALELEHPDVAKPPGRSVVGAQERLVAAEELRVATRDFAEAFLASRVDSCPA
jgi:hypothetical protein